MIPGAPKAETIRPRSSREWLRGASVGLRVVSWVLGAICAAIAVLGLILPALGLGAGRGWTVPRFVLLAIGVYLVSTARPVFLGTGLGLIAGLVRRARSRGMDRARREDAIGSEVATPGDRSDAPVPRARRARLVRRRWRWIAGFALFWPAAGFVIGAYLGRMVDRRLANAITAAERDDPYWRLDDLMAHREPVPDDENSAFLVAEAASMVSDSWLVHKVPPNGSRSPKATLVSKAWDELDSASDNRRLGDRLADTLRAELARYTQAIEVARAVADIAYGRHEIELGPTLMDTPLGETQNARSVARLLAADAAIQAHNANFDNALVSCRAILEVGRSIGDEPFLISQLVRMALCELALQSVRHVLGQGEPTEQSLARLQAVVALEQSEPSLLYGVKGERAMYFEVIRRIREGETPISAFSEHGGTSSSALKGFAVALNSGVAPGVIASWGKLMLDNQLAVTVEWFNDAVAIVRQPAAQHPMLWAKWDANFQRAGNIRFGPIAPTIPLLVTPNVSRVGRAYLRVDCKLSATIILLAAERHRRKTGAWPQSIASIDPAILPVAPVDAYSGQGFRLEHRDGQLFIYSIGPNGKDEHGAFDRKTYWMGGPDDFGTSGWDASLRRQPALSSDEED